MYLVQFIIEGEELTLHVSPDQSDIDNCSVFSCLYEMSWVDIGAPAVKKGLQKFHDVSESEKKGMHLSEDETPGQIAPMPLSEGKLVEKVTDTTMQQVLLVH